MIDGVVTACERDELLPDNCCYDSGGNVTRDPAKALKGAIMAFDRSYKGSHIGLIVELLAGALTGATVETDKKQGSNWGSLVICIDPAVLGPTDDFHSKTEVGIFDFLAPNDISTNDSPSLKAFCNRMRAAKRVSGFEDKRLFLPGERGDEQVEPLRVQSTPVNNLPVHVCFVFGIKMQERANLARGLVAIDAKALAALRSMVG